ncbi:Voltage-gated Ion Channel (VIC) Superfamily [Achlya hypogyna]|uniref:Voltage-gated Ion Channel (VIC) Superfamily n=1 Tax=Achlya hypogyna TaxID=1202772 RepID=A0A1V9ZUJ6_ACHHY|nr:Voltage-gated Ion Channel (VIC) Superfamily [Achlya hypogyna]
MKSGASVRPVSGRLSTRRMSRSVLMVVQARETQRTLDADARAVSIWKLIVLGCILFDAFTCLFILAFQSQDAANVAWSQYAMDAVEAVFVADIVVSMHTSFYEDGNVVTDLQRTRAHYVFSWSFVLDLIPILPLRYAASRAYTRKVLDLLKLVRLLRIPSCAWHLEKMLARYFTLVKLVKVVAACLIVSHLWAFVRGLFSPLNAAGWTSAHATEEEDPWVPYPHNGHVDPLLEAFGLMAGLFEAEVPRQSDQTLFTMAVMFSGVFLFAYICGNFFMISQCHDERSAAFEARRNQLAYILSYHQVPPDVQERAIEYLVHEHETGDLRHREYLEKLTPSIARDVRAELYYKMLAAVSLFHNCPPVFIQALVGRMQTLSVPAGYVLCTQGAPDHTLYFVQTGVLSVLNDGQEVKLLRRGMHYGELTLFRNVTSPHTVTTTTFSVLHLLSRAEVEVVLGAYPSCKITILEFVDKLQTLETQRSRARATLSEVRMVVPVARPPATRWLLRTPIDPKGRLRRLQVILAYHVVMVPLQCAFNAVSYTVTAEVLNGLADMALMLDIYGRFNLSYFEHTELIRDPLKCMQRGLDFPSHLREISTFVRLDGPKKTVLLAVWLLLTYHMTACLYFSMTYLDGYSSSLDEGWLPPVELALYTLNATHMRDGGDGAVEIGSPLFHQLLLSQYAHSLYYAASVITSLGRGVEPGAWHQFFFHYVFMVFGMIFMAQIIDEVQKGITATAVEQVEFLRQRARIQWFLQQQHVPHTIQKRVTSFLDFWWSAHRGADFNAMMQALPAATQREVRQHVFQATLSRFEVIAPPAVLEQLTGVFLDCARVRLYGQGEVIFSAEDYVDGAYFLVQGRVVVLAEPPYLVAPGAAEHAVYGTTTRAHSGCVVAFLAQDVVQQLSKLLPTYINSFHDMTEAELSRSRTNSLSVRWSFKRLGQHMRDPSFTDGAPITLAAAQPHGGTAVDPDTLAAVLWEILMFSTMSYQCAGIPYLLAFGRTNATFAAPGVQLGLELLFGFDILLRTRLGFARAIGTTDLWLCNKLLRMFKLSAQLSRIEQRFVTLNIHIRLFKLLFYTFFMSHWVGCAWYNLASGVTGFASDGTFGSDNWMPPASLLNRSASFQYCAALFWGFGTMSGVSPRIVPQTSLECFFNVFAILAGVFLFSYVLGNLSDLIKVVDGNNRAFYAQLSTLRLFLTRYQFPPALEGRIKHYFFYKSFHSIHQEGLLSECLPPSLLTDTRLFLLQPMISQVAFLRLKDGDQAIKMLVSLLVQELVPRTKIICKQGEIGLEMYFVYAGCLEVFVWKSVCERTPLRALARAKHTLLGLLSSAANRRERTSRLTHAAPPVPIHEHLVYTKVNQILPGSYFGEASLFSDKPRNANIQARTFCTVYKLSREHLQAVFALHPAWKAGVMEIVESQYKAQSKKPSQKRPPTREAPTKQDKVVGGWQRRVAAIFGDPFALRHIEVQSRLYRVWFQVLSMAICHQLLYVPYLLCFHVDVRSATVGAIIALCNAAADAVYWGDIWFRYHLVANDVSLEFYEDPMEGSASYTRVAKFWDVLCAVPLDYLSGLSSIDHPILRLNRCGKLVRLPYAMAEITRFSLANDVNYLKKLIGLYLFIIYWIGCAYFAMTFVDGFGDTWSSWLPVRDFMVTPNSTFSDDIRRMLRSMYYSTGIFTNTGVTLLPTTVHQYLFVMVVCLFCLFMTSYVIGELSTMFVCLTQHEVEHRIQENYTEQYLAVHPLSKELRSRMYASLTYWWNAHRGVRYETVLSELPLEIKGEAMLHLASNALNDFLDNVFKPLAPVTTDLDSLRSALAAALKLETYPHGEFVIVEGNIADTMYFIMTGSLMTTRMTDRDAHHMRRYREGQYFGEEGLLRANASTSSIQTLRACELMALQADDLVSALESVPHGL